MKNYYTYYPICPNCLEPAKSDNLLIKDEIFENMFFCPSCGNHFKNIINLDSEISFPLFKDIKLNIIEKSYIDWIISENCDGKYFITWPWDVVKFIPILIKEYIFRNSDDKLVIFYNENRKLDELNYPEILDYIFYLDEPASYKNEVLLSNEEVFIENVQGYCELFINLLDENSVENFNRIKSNLSDISFITDDLTYYNRIRIPCGFVNETEDCFKRFINNFKELFGVDSIKNVNGLNDEFEYNEHGLFELNFLKKYSLNDNLKINKNISNATGICFENRYNLLSCFYNVNYQIINSNDDLDKIDYDNTIFFINQNLLSEKLVEHINYINPNWILFDSIDQALAKSRYDKFMRKNLFSILGSDFNILLFSTELSRRRGYQIGKKGFIKNMGIIPHTWDYKELLDEIYNNYENNITLFSSNLNNIHGNYSLKMTFCECDELKIMDECLNIFDDVFRGNKDVVNFIRDLIKTPLYIKGDYEKLFRRTINLEYLLAIVFNHDETKWKYMIDSLDSAYGWTSDSNKNPLLDGIINLINQKELKDDEIAIVVHHWDINEVKNVLLEKIPNNEIMVTKWNKLNKDIENTSIKQVIATEFPTWAYNLYNSPLEEIIFVGSPKTIEAYKFFKTNRFTEEGTKPLYILSEKENAPNLLKELLNNIEVPVDDIEDFNEEVNKIIIKTTSSSKNNYSYQNNIKKGSSAILVINKNKEAMFLPYKTIYIHDEDGINGISMYNGKRYEKLINTDILINEQEMYDSFGRLFFKFIIENGNDLVISDGKYEWKGFKELIENMFEWCDILHKIVNMESLDDKKSRINTKKKLEEKLKSLGVKAQSNNYIRNFWLDDPVPLNTSEGELLIYEIEHPRKQEDVFKIYEWISDNYDEFGVSELDAPRVFSAGKTIQNIRPKFFKNKFNETDPLRKLCDEFQVFVKDKINTSNLFNVVSSELVNIVEDVEPYKILDEYDKYYEKN